MNCFLSNVELLSNGVSNCPFEKTVCGTKDAQRLKPARCARMDCNGSLALLFCTSLALLFCTSPYKQLFLSRAWKMFSRTESYEESTLGEIAHRDFVSERVLELPCQWKKHAHFSFDSQSGFHPGSSGPHCLLFTQMYWNQGETTGKNELYGRVEGWQKECESALFPHSDTRFVTLCTPHI